MMITVRLDVFFMLLVSVPLFVLTTLVIYYSVLSRHRPTHSHEAIYSCAHCAHVYAIARHRPMDHCPRCGTLNEAVRT